MTLFLVRRIITMSSLGVLSQPEKERVEGSVFLFFFSCPRLITRMMMMTFPTFYY
jgi:hypothetical protein